MITLPETDPDTFEVYLQWCYQGALVVSDEYNLEQAKHWDDDRQFTVNKTFCDRLERLAVFADSVMDTCFANTIIDSLLQASDKLNMFPTDSLIRCIYNELPRNHVMQKLVVDIWHGYALDEVFKELESSNHPRALLYDTMMSFKGVASGLKENPDACWANRCRYHVHDDMAPRCTGHWSGRYRNVSAAQISISRESRGCCEALGHAIWPEPNADIISERILRG